MGIPTIGVHPDAALDQSKPSTFPDAAYIRKELPIRDVALKLGLTVNGRRVRCPLDQSHWASLWLRKNQIKCFQCMRGPWSTIDLVAESLQLDVGNAIEWIAKQFGVPRCRIRVTTNQRGIERHVYTDYPPLARPARLQPSLAALRRCPGWPKLSHSARLLASYLIDVVPQDSLVLVKTYRELQRRTCIGNRGTVKNALAQLRAVGLLDVAREATGRDFHGRFLTRTVIRLTWGSETFQAFLRATATKYIGSEVNLVEAAKRQESEPGAACEDNPLLNSIGERKFCSDVERKDLRR